MNLRSKGIGRVVEKNDPGVEIQRTFVGGCGVVLVAVE